MSFKMNSSGLRKPYIGCLIDWERKGAYPTFCALEMHVTAFLRRPPHLLHLRSLWPLGFQRYLRWPRNLFSVVSPGRPLPVYAETYYNIYHTLLIM